MHHVTIKDIARIANVSCSTVSRALNGSPELSEGTRARILEICDREGYHVNAMARSLIRGRTNVIGLIVPDVTNSFYSELSLHIENCARAIGYNVIMCNSLYDKNRTKELFSFLLSHKADGIIFASSMSDAPVWLNEFAHGVPSVLLGSTEANIIGQVNSVDIDNHLGGQMAAEHLLSLGHRDILCFGYRPSNASHALRFKGFEEVVNKAGANLDVLKNDKGVSSVSYGYELSKKLFDKPFKYSAVFAMTDSMGLGLIKSADEHGITIPNEFSLIGFDNILYSSLPRIDMATVDQRKEILASTAVDLLIKAITASESEFSTRQLVKPVLIARGSCRKLQ